MFEPEGSALDRAKAYEFLAGIFLKEPTADVFEFLKDWAASLEEDTKLGALLNKIEEKDPTLEGLIQEYYDLFFVPVSGRFVPPFEAAIRGALREEGKKTKFGSFWGSETAQISEIYEQLGFRPDELDVFEPLRQMNMPDHIGFELTFMAYLCQVEENLNKNAQSAESVKSLEKFSSINILTDGSPCCRKNLDELNPRDFIPTLSNLQVISARKRLRFLKYDLNV